MLLDDNIEFFPPKFKNLYRNWLENIKDWPISRQLWWGQQIPAFYYGENGVAVADTKEEALVIAQKENPSLTLDDLKQDEDVVDTWFSSWLLPISVFDGFENPNNEEMKYYYPTSVLVTGWDIIFFWVARMVIAGYEYTNEMPFKKVYFTGMVRDMQRRKMSKSLGNSPDALNLIETFGADGVRVGMLLSSAAGNDLLFDDKLCEQGRNFANKIWNAFRLVKGWEIDKNISGEENKASIDWFEARYNQVLVELEDHFDKFRLSEALMGVYKLVWDDFCSWYLEMIKPEYQQPIDKATYDATINFFEKLVKLMHPFMPFITEEIYQNIQSREANDFLIVAEWPKTAAFDQKIIDEAGIAFEVISNVRNTRNSKGISPKEKLSLFIKSDEKSKYHVFTGVIKKLANLDSLDMVDEKVEKSMSFVLNADEFFIPMEGNIDTEKEKEELLKELKYTQGFLMGVEKKLSNERFVNNAPEQVLANEQKKKADAEAKIKTIEASLASL